jgi:hypothetical protein
VRPVPVAGLALVAAALVCVGFAVAFGPVVAANRYLMRRDKGHALVYEHH